MTRPPASRRQRRLGELIRAEISELLLRHLKDTRIAGLPSITNVEVSPDFKYAKVHVSILGSEKDQESTMIALRHAAGHIQRELGKRLKLRFTPHLRFVLDERIREGDHVLELINRLYPPEGDRRTGDDSGAAATDADD